MTRREGSRSGRSVVALGLLLGLACATTSPPRTGPRPAVVGRVTAVAKDPNAARNVSLQKRLRAWETQGTAWLSEALARQGYPRAVPGDSSVVTWELELEVVYGNRAMRAITGGKAGAGWVRARLVASEGGRRAYQHVVERETRLSSDGWELQWVVDEALEALAVPPEPELGPGWLSESTALPWCFPEREPEWKAASDEVRRERLRACRGPRPVEVLDGGVAPESLPAVDSDAGRSLGEAPDGGLEVGRACPGEAGRKDGVRRARRAELLGASLAWLPRHSGSAPSKR